ncbi:MAG: adenylate/guanylate cyclase domain-containing protein [Chloroflexota bacterium]
MPSKRSGQEFVYLRKPGSPGLWFWGILPILILTTLFMLILVDLSFSAGQWPPLDLMLIVAGSFLAVVGLALLITRRIAQRLRQISQAADQVARGDFSVRLADNRHDEIARLERAFNKMVAELDRLHESRELLSRTMSPAVRQSLLEKGLDFRGVTQIVSILFVDIRDFTRITEGHTTDQVIFFLNDYYTTIANQVQSGGGIIGKYGGDSILAFFGAPTPELPAKSSTAALLTALALLETIEELNERWLILGLPPIRVGVGLSIGSVVTGPIGSEEQFEYTVIGDAVNLASRLQDLTRNVAGYSIMLSKEVYDALAQKIKDQIQVISLDEYEALNYHEKARRPLLFVDLGQVLVKGKKGPVHVYAIPDCDDEP